jgi:hypothetical protein
MRAMAFEWNDIMATPLYIPTEIPWRELKGKDLEEVLYWLFDAMGAKDLEWRIGGGGAGAADGGRDLELSFYVSSPDGDLIKQRWWIEAKGREGTVEPVDVKAAVLNAAGRTEVDVVVVATNAAFSNPTRDWVKDWQRDHPRPRVRLWERTDLESLCSKNPGVVLRLFAKALTPQGRLEVATVRFWDYSALADESTLKVLWRKRAELALDTRSLIALACSELANGDIGARSWAITVDGAVLPGTLGEGLLNFLYLALRAVDVGVRQRPFIQCLAYLMLVCIHQLGPSKTNALITKVWGLLGGREYPNDIRKVILGPVMNELLGNVLDVCTSDCHRVHMRPATLTEDGIQRYWERLKVAGTKPEPDDQDGGSETFFIETFEACCNIGFSVDKAHGCPLIAIDTPEDEMAKTLDVIAAVAKERLARGG